MIVKRERLAKIPGADEWAGYEHEFAGDGTKALWFGKSLDDVQPFFEDAQSIQRAHELLGLPLAVYQFYVFAFAQYVMSDNAIGDSDAASCFLGNLIAREKQEPGSVASIFALLEPTVDFVAASQARYDADHDIYGDFAEKSEELKKLCGATHSLSDPQDQMLDPTDDA